MENGEETIVGSDKTDTKRAEQNENPKPKKKKNERKEKKETKGG